MDTSKCSKCLNIKNLDCFYKDKNSKSGVTRWCKNCMQSQNKNWKKENKENVNQYMVKYRDVNKEKIKIQAKEYKEKHQQELEIKAKEYKEKNRDKIRKLKRDYYHRVEKHSIQVIMRNRLSKRLTKALKGISKSKKTLELLGCDIKFFIEYIENKFLPGMSWDNYGVYGWHVDHINPCNNFDLSDESQQLKCFHYTNLQPMWAPDNCSKQDRWVG